LNCHGHYRVRELFDQGCHEARPSGFVLTLAPGLINHEARNVRVSVGSEREIIGN
jgi:hypothetical protein